MSCMRELRVYGNIKLLDIHASVIENWEEEDATNVRVWLPSKPEYVVEMQKRGFCFADRTLGVSINLVRSSLDYKKFVRLQIVDTDEYKKDILEIAKTEFTYDRRFHITQRCNASIAALVLEEWINEISSSLVCVYKNIPIGFLVLEQAAADSMFVHLAAVKREYRLSGAAISLYAHAAFLAQQRGFRKLEGRVSSMNPPVMNLYACLGASFGEPVDVYLKEV